MLKASALEFRLRYVIYGVLYLIGFTAPWNRWLHLDSAGPNAHLWGTLAAHISVLSPRAIPIGMAFNLFLAAGILFAFIAAALRTWASTYIEPSIVEDAAMYAHRIAAAGPYRYLRNPLYFGLFFHTFALALLMPPTGALFAICSIGLFQLRLIGREESVLTAKFGEGYLAYCAKVSRFLPSLSPRLSASTLRPRWLSAVLGELYFWGVCISFAALGWRYNSVLILQGVLISVGLTLIARAFFPRAAIPAPQR